MDIATRQLFSRESGRAGLWIAVAILLVALLVVATGGSGFAKPLVLLAFIGVSVLAVLDLRVAIAFLLLVAVSDGFLKGWLGSTAYALLMKDYFLGLAVACWLSGRPWRTRGSSWHHPIRLPMAVFALWTLAQVFNPHSSDHHIAVLAGLRAWLIWLGIFFVVHDMIQTRALSRLTIVWIVVLACLSGVYGILQYIYGFGFLGEASVEAMDRAARYGWYTQAGLKVGRIYGLTVHPGAFGVFMGQAMLLGFGCFYASDRAWHRVLCIVGIGIATAALMLSGTRTAMVAAAIGWLGMLGVWRSARLPALAAIVIVPGILLTGNLTDRIAYGRGSHLWRHRVYTIERGWEPLKWAINTVGERPLGHGLGSGVGVPIVLWGKGTQATGMIVENDLGRAALDLGFPGLFAYIWLLWTCLRWSYTACAATRGTRAFPMALAFLGCVIMTEISLFTGTALYLAPGALVFWTCVAGSASLAQQAQGPVAIAEMVHPKTTSRSA